MDAYKIMKNVSEKPPKDDCALYAELLARKLRAFDEPTREILMHDIDELVFRTKRGTLNRTQSHLPHMQLEQPCPSVYNMPPYYTHNSSTSQLYSNSPLSLTSSPRSSSSSLSSENVYIHQPSPNPTISYEPPETIMESQISTIQNQFTEDNQFL